jgi:hypothetical protein
MTGAPAMDAASGIAMEQQARTLADAVARAISITVAKLAEQRAHSARRRSALRHAIYGVTQPIELRHGEIFYRGREQRRQNGRRQMRRDADGHRLRSSKGHGHSGFSFRFEVD